MCVFVRGEVARRNAARQKRTSEVIKIRVLSSTPASFTACQMPLTVSSSSMVVSANTVFRAEELANLGSKNSGTCVWEKAMYMKKGGEPGGAWLMMKERA